MATNQAKLDNINARINWVFENLVNLVRESVLWSTFDVQGTVRPGGRTSVGTEMGYLPQYMYNIKASIDAQTATLIGALAKVAGGGDFDEAKLLADVKAAAADGVKQSGDALLAGLASQSAAIVSAVEGLDIEGDAKAGVIAAIESVTTTTSVNIRTEEGK